MREVLIEHFPMAGKRNYHCSTLYPQLCIFAYSIMETFIYKITNQINGKIYIGKTLNSNPLNRWAKHLSIAKHKTTRNYTYQVIHKAINKYGKENFTFEVIEKCPQESVGLEREKYWIEYYKSNIGKYGSKFGYNSTEGGEGSSGFKHSEESKNKMSQTRKGTRLGSENTFFGKHHSAESIAKIKSKTTGRKLSISEIENRSKLRAADVLDIRLVCSNYATKKDRCAQYRSMAQKYGVSLSLIRMIVNRKRWKNI